VPATNLCGEVAGGRGGRGRNAVESSQTWGGRGDLGEHTLRSSNCQNQGKWKEEGIGDRSPWTPMMGGRKNMKTLLARGLHERGIKGKTKPLAEGKKVLSQAKGKNKAANFHSHTER